jgi:hypothetical protein
MKLDERAGRAATDLLDRASRRPIPTVEALEQSRVVRRLPVRRVLAAAAAIAVVVGGLAFVNRDRPLPTVEHPTGLPVPAGVTPQLVMFEGTGISVEVPSTWEASTATRGFQAVYVDGKESYVAALRGATTDPMDVGDFADLRRDMLRKNVDADIGDVSRTTIDGHDALVLEVVASGISFHEYAIDLEDSTWAIVSVGERMPVEHGGLEDWIASTITVDAAPLWSTPIDHPAEELPVPDGIAPRTWKPAREGFAIDLPVTWKAPEDPRPDGFDVGMQSTNGPFTFAYAARVSHALGAAEGRRRVLDRQLHARIVEQVETVVDGHATQILRYRFPVFDEPRLANLCTEYDVDLGTGESVYIALCSAGGSPTELVDWIRSTIRITG